MGEVFVVEYDPDAFRDPDALDRENQREIVHAIDARLTVSPIVFGKPLRHSLKGARVLRVGDYRIVFKIEGMRVRVGLIAHRSQVYELARRRIV